MIHKLSVHRAWHDSVDYVTMVDIIVFNKSLVTGIIHLNQMGDSRKRDIPFDGMSRVVVHIKQASYLVRSNHDPAGWCNFGYSWQVARKKCRDSLCSYYFQHKRNGARNAFMRRRH